MDGDKARDIKAILFDVGSTLLYPSPSVAETFVNVAHSRGHDFSLADVEPHMAAIGEFYEAEYVRDGDFWCSHEGSTAIWLDQYRYLCHLAGVAQDAESVAAAMHAAYHRPDHWMLYPDVLSCLRALKERRFALAVVSNWGTWLEDLLRGLQMLPYFDVVISSADVGYRKPNPIIFELALEQIGRSAEEVLHVGDHLEADGVGAASAGIRPVIIDRQGIEERCIYTRITRLTDVLELV